MLFFQCSESRYTIKRYVNISIIFTTLPFKKSCVPLGQKKNKKSQPQFQRPAANVGADVRRIVQRRHVVTANSRSTINRGRGEFTCTGPEIVLRWRVERGRDVAGGAVFVVRTGAKTGTQTHAPYAHRCGPGRHVSRQRFPY